MSNTPSPKILSVSIGNLPTSNVNQKVSGTIDIIKKNTSVPASVVYLRIVNKRYFSFTKKTAFLNFPILRVYPTFPPFNRKMKAAVKKIPPPFFLIIAIIETTALCAASAKAAIIRRRRARLSRHAAIVIVVVRYVCKRILTILIAYDYDIAMPVTAHPLIVAGPTRRAATVRTTATTARTDRRRLTCTATKERIKQIAHSISSPSWVFEKTLIP